MTVSGPELTCGGKERSSNGSTWGVSRSPILASFLGAGPRSHDPMPTKQLGDDEVAASCRVSIISPAAAFAIARLTSHPHHSNSSND